MSGQSGSGKYVRSRTNMKEVRVTDGNVTEVKTLDVREVTPRERHPLIFQSIDDLKPGTALRLVNDHDPKPLYYQLMAERPGKVDWTYLEEGPETWQVRITRKAS
jgi:uncharacterized protein (DUF2249 family)